MKKVFLALALCGWLVTGPSFASFDSDADGTGFDHNTVAPPTVVGHGTCSPKNTNLSDVKEVGYVPDLGGNADDVTYED